MCPRLAATTTCRVPHAGCPPERLRLLQVRNPLLACLKNYDDENFNKVLPAMLALANRRAFMASGLAAEDSYRIENMKGLPKVGRWQDLRRRLRKARAAKQPIDKIAAADWIAINDVMGDWQHWMAVRADLQAKRKRKDEEILRLFLRPHWCIEGGPGLPKPAQGLERVLWHRPTIRRKRGIPGRCGPVKLSVVMPVYNEERTLEEIVSQVLATPFEKEILLVDDGSVDRTREIILRLEKEHPEIRAILHKENRGKGGALATGFGEAQGDVVIIQDADLEYDPGGTTAA